MDYQKLEDWFLGDYDKAPSTVHYHMYRLKWLNRDGLDWEAFLTDPAKARDMVRSWVANTKRDESTTNHKLRTGLKAVNWMVDYANRHYGERWLRWKLPREPVSEPKTLTADQVNRLRGYTHKSEVRRLRRRAFLAIAEWTGIRTSEIHRIKRSCIDLDQSRIWLADTAKGGIRRYLLLPSWATGKDSRLQEWLQLLKRRGCDGDALWWGDPRGRAMRPLTAKVLQNDWNAISDWAGFRVGSTRFRRVHSQLLDDHNVPMRTISYTKGHNKRETTERYLAKVTAERALRDLREAHVPGY